MIGLIKYIALLRGINVGGKNKIPMADLRKIFKIYTFADISTVEKSFLLPINK